MTPSAMTVHDNHARRPVFRLLVVLAIVVGLVACARTTVVRETRSAPPRVSTPQPGKSVVVQRGDTLYRIAVNNGISPMDLALWNGISPPYTIYPGQRLKLYPPTGSARARTQGGVASRPSSRGTAASGRATAQQGTASQASRPPSQPSTAAAPAQSPVRWRWPTDGHLVGRFVAGDPTRQGVDIAGTAGQPVRAAADGVVVYSGSGLVGYGELVIIKHDEQWLSAYGHNRRRLVEEGARVGAGQQIAEMGRTGASRDMLHFEIRYNGKPVDPLLYLPQR